MSAFVEAIVAAATYRAQRRLLRVVVNAKYSLGLDPNQDLARLKDIQYSGPTLVEMVRFRGLWETPASDDGSAEGTFWTPGAVDLRMRPRRLGDAKALVSEGLIESQGALLFEECPRNAADLSDDGWFNWPELVTEVVLLDTLRRPVAIASVKESGAIEWSPTPGQADIPGLLAKASELAGLATEEASWDNFDSSRGLSAQAEHQRCLAKIAAYAPQVVP